MRLMLALASLCCAISWTSWPVGSITIQMILSLHFKLYLRCIQYWTTDHILPHDQNENRYIRAFQFCCDYWKIHFYMCAVCSASKQARLTNTRWNIARLTSDRSILFPFQLYGPSRNEIENFILKEECVRRPLAHNSVKISRIKGGVA
jgi:hypothetical protein